MRKNFLSIFLLFSICFTDSLHAEIEKIKSLENKPLPQENFPQIQRQTLQNGLKLLSLQDEEFPVVRGFIYVRVGSIYEPADKLGMTEMMGELLRSGGTQKTSAAKMDELLDFLGAEVSIDFDREAGKINFVCLKEDFPQVLKLVFEMMKEPAFAQEKVELTRLKMLEALRRQNDEPASIGKREFTKLQYGQNNIWSRTPTVASVKSITRQDLTEYHQKYFGPNRVIIGLSGDFSLDVARKLIEKESRDWNPIKTALPKIEKLEKKWPAQKLIFNKKTDQTTIFMGHYGDRRTNPDKFALLVMNSILGGDLWTSRLGKRIRSTLGLSYGIYSSYDLQTDHGLFSIFAQTKVASTLEVIEETQKILKEIAQGKSLTQAELDLHKESILNSLYSEYDPPYNFLKNEVRFEYFGYPPYYLQIFREKISQVKLEDVQRVASQYLRPEKISILIVGDKTKLTNFSKYQVKELQN